MAKNFVNDGDVLNLTAPVAGVVSGTPVILSEKLVLPLNTASAGESFAGSCAGVWYVAKAGVAVEEGDPAFYDDSTGDFSNVAGVSGRRVGYFTADGAAGATAGYVAVVNAVTPEVVGARQSTNTAQPTASATVTKITLEDDEIVGAMDYDAGDFTIPESGVYLVTYEATFAGHGTGDRNAYAYVGENAIDSETMPEDDLNPVTVRGNTAGYLAALSVLSLRASQDSGGALNVTAARMAIQRIQ